MEADSVDLTPDLDIHVLEFWGLFEKNLRGIFCHLAVKLGP
jgi:hypothetical protein